MVLSVHYDYQRLISEQHMEYIDSAIGKNTRLAISTTLAIITGYSTVQYLVQTLDQIAIYSVLLLVSASATIFTITRIIKPDYRLLAIGLAIIGVTAGYTGANAMFLSQTDNYPLPEITRTDGGDGHTAILYFTHGEPPGYSPVPWALTMQELDNDNVPFVPWLARPFFFNTVRNQYQLAGGSPHNKLHQTYIDNLRRAMPEEQEKGTRFYLAFLDNEPHPDQMTIKAINEGASKIIILPVFITESTHTIAGLEMIQSINPEKYGVKTYYTGALGDSEYLHESFVERACNFAGNCDKNEIGILLVGHGQPTTWENIYPEQNQQETQYRDEIRYKLTTSGFKAENIIQGWMSFQEPSIMEAAHTLENQGVTKILVVSVSLSAEAIHSQVDVPTDINEADLPEDITVEYIGQYCDHPLAIQAMIDKIKNVQQED